MFAGCRCFGPGGGIGAQELHGTLLGAEVAQGVGDEFVADVPLGVENEALVTESAALGRPRGHVCEIDAARGELLENGDQAARFVGPLVDDDRGAVMS